MPVHPGDTFHFCVVCPNAQQIFLLGDFNNWSTTATPMQNTEEHVWQISMRVADHAAPTGRKGFAYFVVGKDYGTGRAPFGPTFCMPGTWATVLKGERVA